MLSCARCILLSDSYSCVFKLNRLIIENAIARKPADSKSWGAFGEFGVFYTVKKQAYNWKNDAFRDTLISKVFN